MINNNIEKDQRVTVTRQDLSDLNDAVNAICNSAPEFPISLKEITQKISPESIRVSSTNWVFNNTDEPFILTPAHFAEEDSFNINETIVPDNTVENPDIGFTSVGINVKIDDVALSTDTEVAITVLDENNSTNINFDSNDVFGAKSAKIQVNLEDCSGDNKKTLTSVEDTFVPSSNCVGISAITVKAPLSTFNSEILCSPDSHGVQMPPEGYIGFSSIEIPETDVPDSSKTSIELPVSESNEIENAIILTSSNGNNVKDPDNLIFRADDKKLGFREVSLEIPGSYEAIINRAPNIAAFGNSLDNNNLIIISNDKTHALTRVEIPPVQYIDLEISADTLSSLINDTQITKFEIYSTNEAAPLLNKVMLHLPTLVTEVEQARFYNLKIQSKNAELNDAITNPSFACIPYKTDNLTYFEQLEEFKSDNTLFNCYHVRKSLVESFAFSGILCKPTNNNFIRNIKIIISDIINNNSDFLLLDTNLALTKLQHQNTPVSIIFNPTLFNQLYLDSAEDYSIEGSSSVFNKLNAKEIITNDIDINKIISISLNDVVNLELVSSEAVLDENGNELFDEEGNPIVNYFASDLLKLATTIHDYSDKSDSYLVQIIVEDSPIIQTGSFNTINDELSVNIDNNYISIVNNETAEQFTYEYIYNSDTHCVQCVNIIDGQIETSEAEIIVYATIKLTQDTITPDEITFNGNSYKLKEVVDSNLAD